jgi:hypothetical protein
MRTNYDYDSEKGFRYTMKIFWGGTCVAIFGYLSECEMFDDYVKEMDKLPTNGTIFVQKHW